MYRSAFNHFHAIVVSVTKRLVQTALIQATSRLRSQRLRVKKNSIPLVKKRDVLTAIGILGLKRDGQERWRGVARRCGLRVYEGKWSRYRHNRSRREVPWDQVERVMGPVEPDVDPQTTDAEMSDDEDEEFRPKAARMGTPLPMERLALSDSDDASPSGESPPPTPSSVKRESRRQAMSLEQFDQNRSREEERALCALLAFEPISRDNSSKSCEDSDGSIREDGSAEDEEVVANHDDWRSWTEYRAEWDELHAPISPAEFLANQKPAAVPPVLQPDTMATTGSSSNHDTDAPTRASRKATKPKPLPTIELEALDASAYARQQGRAAEYLGSSIESSDEETDSSTRPKTHAHSGRVHNHLQGRGTAHTDMSIEDCASDMDMDVPAQSIETDNRRPPVVDPDDEMGEMDWSTYIE